MNNNWYHGSNKKIHIFNPNSFDLGNAFQTPGWSTFCFKNYEYTEKFAIMRLIQNYYSTIKNEDNQIFLHNNRCTWDFINEKAITTEEGFKFITDHLIGKKVYIHIFDSTKLVIKGIGNDITHNEFTFRDKNVKPIQIDTIILDEEKLKQTISIVNDINKYRDKLVELSKYYNRGFLTLFINLDYTINRSEIEKIIVAINMEKLNPGENISDFIETNNINIKKIRFIIRVKNSICGIMCHLFLRKLFIRKLKRFDLSIKDEVITKKQSTV